MAKITCGNVEIYPADVRSIEPAGKQRCGCYIPSAPPEEIDRSRPYVRIEFSSHGSFGVVFIPGTVAEVLEKFERDVEYDARG